MKLKQSYTKKKLTEFAKTNRKEPTKAENKFWQNFRARRFLGYKFRRQVPISNYIIDFYCEELKLVVEIDGSSHDEKKFEYDRRRESELRDLGLTILRFTEYNVMKNFDKVNQTIEDYVNEFTSSVPTSRNTFSSRRRDLFINRTEEL